MDSVNERILRYRNLRTSGISLADQFSFNVLRPQSCPGAKSKHAGHFLKERKVVADPAAATAGAAAAQGTGAAAATKA